MKYNSNGHGQKVVLCVGILLLVLVAVFLCTGVALAGPTEVSVNPSVTEDVYNYHTIQDAIDAVDPGGTVHIEPATYDLSSTVNVNKPRVKLVGAGSQSTVVKVTSSIGYAFKLTASGTSLEGLQIEKTDKAGVQNLIYVGADNVTIRNNLIFGCYGLSDNDVSRGMEVECGVSGLLVEGNTIHSLRQPAYLNPGVTGTIRNNHVAGTKGWVIDRANLTFTGNTWGSGDSVNYLDIAILPGTDPSYYPDILALSAANNGAVVEDQRPTPRLLTSVWVDAAADPGGDGTITKPYQTVSAAVPRVVAGGTIHVAAGTYIEQVEIAKPLTLEGAGSGTVIKSPDLLTRGFNTSAPNKPIIYVHDTTGASIRNLKVDGDGKGNANYRFQGIAYYNAGGTIEDLEIIGVRDTPLSGMQAGVAIYAYNADDASRTLEVKDCEISDFQKNGMALNGAGLTVTVTGNTVTGAGPTALIAQNGIQIGYGAVGTVTGNHVTGCRYTGSPDWSAAGILLYQAGEGTTATGNQVSQCQYGVDTDLQSSFPEVQDNAFSDNVANVHADTDAWSAPTEVSVDSQFTQEKGVAVGTGLIKDYNVFSSIQPAIDQVANGGIVSVSAGEYASPISINGKTVTVKGAGKNATIVRPASLLSTGVGHKYDSNMKVAVFVNDSTYVHIQDITVDGNALDGNAVIFWNASSGSLDNLKIMNPCPFSGIQTGQGIAVDAGAGKTTVLDVNDCEILDFNKNGIDVITGNGATTGGGTITVNVNGGTITGRGPTNVIAQNGMLFWERGGGTAGGSVHGVTISGIEYAPTTDEACGVLIYGSPNGTVTIENCVFRNVEQYTALVAGSTRNIDVSTCTFDGVAAANATPAQLGMIEDKIIHKMDDASVGLVTLKPNTIIATTNNRGIQAAIDAATSGDTVHVAPSSYTLGNELTIPEGVTLRLEPGATIKFSKTSPAIGVTVNGTLLAEGTEAQPVTFTSGEATPVPGDWNKISFGPTATGSKIDHCVIEYGTTGVSVVWDAITEEKASPVTITNSTFQGIRSRGVEFRGWDDPTKNPNVPRRYYPVKGIVVSGNKFINVGKGTDGNPMAIYTRSVKDVTISDNLFQGGEGTYLAYLGVAFENYQFKNNTITDPGYQQGVYVSTTRGTPEILNNTFQGVASASNFRCISTNGHDSVIVRNNNFYTGSSGVYLVWYPYGTQGNLIEGNVFDGVGTGTSDSYAVAEALYPPQFGGVRKTIIRDNIIRNTNGVGIYACFGDWGTVAIEGNTIENNTVGIRVGDKIADQTYGLGGITAHRNTIINNRTGVENIEPEEAHVFDATLNWFGDMKGPSHPDNGEGKGDSIVGNVKYSPWSAAAGSEDKAYASATLSGEYDRTSRKAQITITKPVTVTDVNAVKVQGAIVTPTYDVPENKNAFKVDVYEGANVVWVELQNAIGNVFQGSCTVGKDTLAPVTQVTRSRAPDGLDGWYKGSRPAVTLSTEAGATIHYRWNDADWQSHIATEGAPGVTVEVLEGQSTLRYYSTDATGNAETEGSMSFKVDTVAPAAPAIAVASPVKTATVGFTATAEAGANIEVRVNGIPVSAAGGRYTANLIEGSNTIEARATDVAGNRSGWATATVVRDSKGPRFNINTSQAGSTVNVEVIPSDADGPVVLSSSTVKIGDGSPQALTLTLSGQAYTGSFALPQGTVSFTISVTGKDALGNENTASYTAAYVNASSGGTVQSGNTEVVIPPNALQQNTQITVREAAGDTYTEANMNIATNPQEFGPAGTRFQQQVRITFEYDEDANETKLGVYYWDPSANGGAGDWVYVGGEIDGAHNTISVDTDHFSVYGVFEDTTPPPLTIDNRDALDGSVTNNQAVTIAGSTEPGAEVRVNGVATAVNDDGTFSRNLPLAEGANTITVVAKDWAANEITDTLTVTKDSSCALAVTGPVHGSRTKNTTTTVSGTSEAGATVTVKLNGVTKAETVIAGAGFSIPVSGLAEGDNTIRVESRDAAGNSAAPVTLTITLDTLKPSLVVTSPVNGLVTRDGSVEVAGQTEAGAAVTVGGVAVTNNNGVFTKQVSLSEGANTITVRATDVGGTSEVTLTVYRDSTRPASSHMITGTKSGQWYVGSSPAMTLAATDAHDYTVYYSIDGGAWLTYPGVAVPLPEGEHTITYYAVDEVGNQETPGKSFLVKVDTIKPVITLVRHDATKPLKSGEKLTITLQGEYEDGYRYTAEAAVGSIVVPLLETETKGVYRGSYTVKAGDNLADVTVVGRLKDPAGNTATRNAAEKVSLDNTPPSGSVTINGGAASTSSRSVMLTIVTADAAYMKVSDKPDLSGAAWEAVSGSKSWSLGGPNGAKTVYVKFKDLAGNESEVYSDSISLEIAPTGGGGGGGGGAAAAPVVQPPVVAGSTTKEVKAGSGGTVALADNSAVVTLPPAATAEDVKVTIAPVVEVTQPTEGMVKIGNRVYEVICEKKDGGTVRSFSKPITLTFQYKDEELSGVAPSDLKVFYWDEGAGAWIALPTTVDPATKTVVGTTDHLTVFALMAKPGMPAMPDIKGHWSEKFVLRLVSLGVVGGYSDGSFKPEVTINREQFAKMVVLAAGLQPDSAPALVFVDSRSISEWARGYVATAVRAGIIKGLDGNRFGPAEPVTRAQVATMVVRALGIQPEATATAFRDNADIPVWAVGSVQSAVEKGIVGGFEDQTFKPGLSTTRAQAAKMLSEFMRVRTAR